MPPSAALLCDLTWEHFGVFGLSLDIAGAVILAWSFSTKTPAAIREDVPEQVGGLLSASGTEIDFPQGMSRSLARQRAEARLGLVLLSAGFAMQAVIYFAPASGPISNPNEIMLAAIAALCAGVIAVVGMKTYVPWDEGRTLAEIGLGRADHRR